MNATRIIELIDDKGLRKVLVNPIVLSAHALTHPSIAQRKVYKEEDLKTPLLQENPALAGIQKNGNHAAYFKRKAGYLKIVFSIKNNRTEIITYMYTEDIPRLK